jgi:hypothetical protein
MMVQPFLGSVLTQGELSLMVIGGRCTHAVRKIAKPGDFRVQDDHGGTVHPHAPTADEIAFAEAAVAACPQVPLYARVDAVRDDLGALSDQEDLTVADRQWMQRYGIPADEDRGGFWMAEGVMRQAMATWRYPYHFIDFETSAVALPFHAGMRPYEQVAFQFSHHVMHADGRVVHQTEFLNAKAGAFPNFEFIRSLHKALSGDQGTVFMWSPHENTILNKISTTKNKFFIHFRKSA